MRCGERGTAGGEPIEHGHRLRNTVGVGPGVGIQVFGAFATHSSPGRFDSAGLSHSEIVLNDCLTSILKSSGSTVRHSLYCRESADVAISALCWKTGESAPAALFVRLGSRPAVPENGILEFIGARWLILAQIVRILAWKSILPSRRFGGCTFGCIY